MSIALQHGFFPGLGAACLADPLDGVEQASTFLSSEASIPDDSSDAFDGLEGDFVMCGLDEEAPSHHCSVDPKPLPNMTLNDFQAKKGEPAYVRSPPMSPVWSRSPSPCRVSSPTYAWPSTPECSPLRTFAPMEPITLPMLEPLDDAAVGLEAAPVCAQQLDLFSFLSSQSSPSCNTDFMAALQAHQGQQAMWPVALSAGPVHPNNLTMFLPPMAPTPVAPQVPVDSSPRRAKGTGNSRRRQDNGAILPAPAKQHGADLSRTTVMLRNMPNNQTRRMLLDLLDREGFQGQFDFLYLPMDFERKASLGYAFINVVSHQVALRLQATFDGFTAWSVPSRKVCGVGWSQPHQGVQANVERYRNSPVMHEDVPDAFKPVLFSNSARIAFPSPTRKLRPPGCR